MSIKYQPRGAACSVEGCSSPVQSRTWCRKHYKRWEAHGDPLVTKHRDVCTIDGCGKKHFGRGYCDMHYYRWRVHGDPLVGGRSIIPSYRAIHQRVVSRCGQATDHECVDCGKPAVDWSYSNACSDEIDGWTQRRGGTVSARWCPHPDCYFPRCGACHWDHDRRDT